VSFIARSTPGSIERLQSSSFRVTSPIRPREKVPPPSPNRFVAQDLAHVGHALQGHHEERAREGNAAVRRSAALRALELDPNLSDVHSALAAVAFEDWDWESADRAYRRALELNPDSINACACYGNSLAAWSRVSEAIEINRHAERVNPLSPFGQFNYGFVLYVARRFDGAVPHFKRAIELEPQYGPAYLLLSYAYAELGKTQEAVAVVDRPEFQGSATLGRALAQAGRRPEALAIAEGLHKRGVDPFGLAALYFALGENAKGVERLTRAFDQRVGFVRWANVDPAFDAVRSEPRFQALVSRLHLPQTRAVPAREARGPGP